MGRLQIFNNWSPYLVADPIKSGSAWNTSVTRRDECGRMPDDEMIELAPGELDKIGIIEADDVLDSTVIRMPKTYPALFRHLRPLRRDPRIIIDGFENLFLMGRNGMHKYNNQDHSMLTAMTAVDNILSGRPGKENIWSINTEQGYHEGASEDM